MFPGRDRTVTVVFERLDSGSDAGRELDRAAVRKRPIEKQRANRQQPPSHLQEVIEDLLLFDLSRQRLREVGQERQTGLPGLSGGLRQVQIGDIDRDHLNQGFVDDRIHHRLHLGIEPVHGAVGVFDPNQLVPRTAATFEHGRNR